MRMHMLFAKIPDFNALHSSHCAYNHVLGCKFGRCPLLRTISRLRIRTGEPCWHAPTSPTPYRAQHEAICRICRDGGTLLCCDEAGCSGTYHLQCLDPPLTRAPKGHWACPACVNPIADLERILASRAAAGVPAKEGSGGAGAPHTEFLIKWKLKSYRKCTWLKLTDLVAAGRQFPGIQARLRNFQAQPPSPEPFPTLHMGHPL